MQFIKNLLINIALLLGMGVFLYILFPGIMGLVYQAMFGLLGPLLIVIIIFAAIPPRSKWRSKPRNKFHNYNKFSGNVLSGTFGIAGLSTRKVADEKHKISRNYLIMMVVVFIIGSVLLSKSQMLGIGGLGILIIAVVIKYLIDFADLREKKVRREDGKYVRGAVAEEEIGLDLMGLGPDYFILNDIRSSYGNIDHIVIHKQNGIFLVETKSHHGNVTIQDGRILINDHEPEKDFLGQILKNTYWLRETIMEKLSLEPWIKPILVFTNAFVDFKLPTIKNVSIVNQKFLTSILEKQNIKPIHPLIWEKREKIAEILS
jgi:hypothetical protein